jgi:hypothetical protein
VLAFGAMSDKTLAILAGLSLGFVAVVLVGFWFVLGLADGEYWCEDRHPWWGPPESGTNPECGFGYEEWHRRSP